MAFVGRLLLAGLAAAACAATALAQTVTRFFMVLSGTWWVGSGPDFNPDATLPMPAGSHVIHYAKGVHFDGAKAEPAPSWCGARDPQRRLRSARRRRSSAAGRSGRCDHTTAFV